MQPPGHLLFSQRTLLSAQAAGNIASAAASWKRTAVPTASRGSLFCLRCRFLFFGRLTSSADEVPVESHQCLDKAMAHSPCAGLCQRETAVLIREVSRHAFSLSAVWFRAVPFAVSTVFPRDHFLAASQLNGKSGARASVRDPR